MATKKANNASQSKIPVSAKIDRMIERENATVKAYASVNIGGAFVIKDIAVVDGQKGMFARMPFRSYKTGSGETKYSDIAFADVYKRQVPLYARPTAGVHPRAGLFKPQFP